MLGGDENGQPFKDWAFEEWRSKYSVKPPWLTKQFVALAGALKVSESEEVARAAWSSYLASTDPFYEGHPPTKFLQSIDRWTVKAKPRNLHRDKMRDDDPWAQRTKALQRIYAEVHADPSIHELDKRSECSRRFREEFPDEP
jgi:hypothetical protein